MKHVKLAYMEVLNRLPDEDGLNTYKNMSEEQIKYSLKRSSEYFKIKNYDNNSFISFLLKVCVKNAGIKIDLPKVCTNCALIVEGRCLMHFFTIVKLTCLYIPSDWGLIIVCTDMNKEYIKSELKNYITGYTLQIITEMNNVEDYNNLLLSKYFWESILKQIDHVLIFQSDSFLWQHGIENFVKYKYIGARSQCGKIMNGGLSLRNVHWCRKQINTESPLLYENEDMFFSRLLDEFPSPEKQDEFSVEQCKSDKIPLGVHKLWFYQDVLFNKYVNILDFVI